MKNINEILALTDEIEIIEAVGTIIWSKKQESDKLTEGETNFILIDIFEGAINEGGFLHFFNNELGDYAREVLEAYKKIGAPKTANIIAKAIGSFGINNFSDEFEKRKAAILKLDELVLSGWEDLEEIFFEDEQEEDVVALIVEYIRNNKEQFS
ncbi:DUF4375 domain-containing protein [Flavobacterium sp.]|jgi:hypothetical protein|uniref:DMP19 family protein n=1 Tax=Flavobacterium sp. TaxID=239 RepID=UPI002A8058B3|nr:DUF4375 domain-containing protein [Flavobacterium sp.]